MRPQSPPLPNHPSPLPVLRPVRGRAVFAVTSLACLSLVAIGAGVIDLWYASMVDRLVVDIRSVSTSEVTTRTMIYALSGVVWGLAFVLAAVAFLVWLFRVRVNAEVLAPDGHRHTRSWVIAGWLVPIIALWFPKQIVDDIWYASARDVERPGSRILIDVWWVAWVVGSLVANVAARLLFTALFNMRSGGGDLESTAFAARFDLVGIAMELVAAALAVAVIVKITRRQEARLATAGEQDLDLGPARPPALPMPARPAEEQAGNVWIRYVMPVLVQVDCERDEVVRVVTLPGELREDRDDRGHVLVYDDGFARRLDDQRASRALHRARPRWEHDRTGAPANWPGSHEWAEGFDLAGAEARYPGTDPHDLPEQGGPGWLQPR